MSRHHALTTTILLAFAASAGAQVTQKPAPNLPPFLPDVKTPAEYLPTTETVTREEVAARRAARPPKDPSAVGPAPVSVLDFTRLYFDEPGDGSTWVRGRTYKAGFDRAGATYIPFLGSQAPRNFPVRVELAEAKVGGASIALERRGVSRQGNDVIIDRGAVREVWHMGLDSAEQTFVFDSRPAMHGALELRLDIETELAVRAESDGFVLDGAHGGVSIGRATAIDANGWRLDLDARLEGTHIAIHVPAEFAASARFPLIVDPVYTTNTLDTFPNECSAPDVANSAISGNYAAVYEYAYSATDADIWTVDLYFGIPVAGSGTWVDSTSTLWQLPRLAHNALSDTYLTVAQRRTAPSAAAEIWCRARTAGTSSQFAQTLVQSNILGSCFYADVGGDPALAPPTYFLTAWTRNFGPNDWDVHARLIGGDGTPVGGPILLANTDAFEWGPSVSKTNGRPPYATQNWNVVWMRNTTSSNLDIFGAQVRWDGTVTSPAFPIDTNGVSDTYPSASSPLDASFGPRPWMAAWQRNFVGDSDIQAAVLSGSTILSNTNLSALENADIAEAQIRPDVDSNGKRFVVAYTESYNGSTTDHDAYVMTVAHTDSGLRLDEGHAQVDYSFRDTYGIQIACGVTESNQGFPYYGLAWPQYGSGPGDVFCGAYYEPASYETFCSGDGTAGACPCGNVGGIGRGCANSVTNGAGLGPDGANFVSADTFRLVAFNMPSSASCLFFQGTLGPATGTAFGDGLRCVSGTIIRIATKTAVNGLSSYPEAGEVPISVRGLVPAAGAERSYQAWYRNAAAFCTASTFNTTSGVRVRWLR